MFILVVVLIEQNKTRHDWLVTNTLWYQSLLVYIQIS